MIAVDVELADLVDLDQEVPCLGHSKICGPAHPTAAWAVRFRCPDCRRGRSALACDRLRAYVRAAVIPCRKCKVVMAYSERVI